MNVESAKVEAVEKNPELEARETLEKAKQLLQKEEEEKIGACSAEIQAVLMKYNCFFDIGMLITAKGNIPQFAIRYAGPPGARGRRS